MSTLEVALSSGAFVITTELNPPKGTHLTSLLEKAERLKGLVNAINLTDSHTARMTMTPVAAAHLLLDRGVESILQVTGRDRNRLALQADLLGAAALGVTNVLCMSGDDPRGGDHPDAKPVFDLDAIALLRAVSSLHTGYDLGGRPLSGSPHFYAGAVVNPGAPDLDTEVQRLADKIAAGACFFQTQAVYDFRAFETFMNTVQKYKVPIIAGVLLLKSQAMAQRLNATVSGIMVPEEIIQEFDRVEDRAARSVEIAGRLIR